jgi:DNA-binding FrmR family transcriptional regulator
MTTEPDAVAPAAPPVPNRAPMTLDPARMGPAVERLEAARAQIGEILALIEEGEGCAEIVGGLAEVSKALDRVGFGVIALGLRQCAANPDGQEMDRATMERLFLTLA